MAKKTNNITLTNEELQAIIAGAVAQALAAQAPTKSAAKGKGTKTQTKSAKKPTTRTEAVAAWKAERDINDDTKAKYKSIYDAKWAKDWAKWANSAEAKALKGAARKEANQAKAKELRNGYRKLAGMNSKSFEK